MERSLIRFDFWLGQLESDFQSDLYQYEHMRGGQSTRYDTEIIQIQQTYCESPFRLEYIA